MPSFDFVLAQEDGKELYFRLGKGDTEDLGVTAEEVSNLLACRVTGHRGTTVHIATHVAPPEKWKAFLFLVKITSGQCKRKYLPLLVGEH